MNSEKRYTPPADLVFDCMFDAASIALNAPDMSDEQFIAYALGLDVTSQVFDRLCAEVAGSLQEMGYRQFRGAASVRENVLEVIGTVKRAGAVYTPVMVTIRDWA